MTITETIIANRVSRAEMERRWAAVRAAMRSAGVDALLAQADSGPYMGYVRYLADLVPPGSSGVSIVFPQEGGTTVIRQGPDADVTHDPTEDLDLRGVSRILSTIYAPSVSYTAEAEGALIAKALQLWASGTIGILGSQRVSMAAADGLRRALPQATLIDVTEILDPIIARKSEEEKDFIRAAGRLQDAVIARTFDEITPGMTQNHVARLADGYARQLGATQGFALSVSAPLGSPAIPRANAADRVIEKGDLVQLILELDAPGGYFVHATRGLVFGGIPANLSHEYQIALGAQRFLAESACQEITGSALDSRYAAYLAETGRPYSGGSYCHGHGYDILQRPIARAEETLTFGPDMNIGVHPMYLWEGNFIWVNSNFLTSETGPEPVHNYPAELTAR